MFSGHRMVSAAEEPSAARKPAMAAAVVNGTGTGKGEGGGASGHSSGTQSANPISGIDDVQLCFNKAHFTRADFSVQRFLNLTRRYAFLLLNRNFLTTIFKISMAFSLL